MGEAILARGGASQVISYFGNAVIRAQTFNGAVVKCTNGTVTYSKTSTGVVDFPVVYGEWTLTSTYNGSTRTGKITVEALAIHHINLKGYTFGINIDTSASDPNGAVTYTDDAVGFTPLSVNLSSGVCSYGSWKNHIVNVFGCKPCLYKSGARVGYLKETNYAQFENGSSADITSGNAGDVMVEFKKTWYRYRKNGATLSFQVSDYDRSSEGWVSTAFTSENNGAAVNYMYYSAYEGYNLSNKIRSLSGKTVTPNITYTNSRSYCKANGTAYGMENWCKRYYILGLLMLVCKGRGIQANIGWGCVSAGAGLATGTMNSAGLFYGKSDGKAGVKCFGIENMWGSFYNWCDGIVTMSSTTLGFKGTAPYNNTGSGYTTVVDGYTRNSGLYPTDYIPILNGAAITASVGQSNANIGWADYVVVYSGAGVVAGVGGVWGVGLDFAGPFCAGVDHSPSSYSTGIAPRLVAA